MGVDRLVPRQAVFLDRDGVLNAAHHVDGIPRPPAGPDQVRVLPGVAEACARLRGAQFLLIVATNQPDVARGAQNRDGVEQINESLRAQVPLDDFFVCYHDDADECSCRKPRPGLLLEAAKRWDIDLTRSYMVGDRWRDVEAGSGAGCRTILVGGVHERVECNPDHVTESLIGAADWILSRAQLELDP